jgi:hypothetical protein
MGVEVQASGGAPQGGAALAQPAYGEYTEQPDVEAQHENAEQKSSRHHWVVRLVQWPTLLAILLIEIAWLLLLGYGAHRFVLQPILGY